MLASLHQIIQCNPERISLICTEPCSNFLFPCRKRGRLVTPYRILPLPALSIVWQMRMLVRLIIGILNLLAAWLPVIRWAYQATKAQQASLEDSICGGSVIQCCSSNILKALPSTRAPTASIRSTASWCDQPLDPLSLACMFSRLCCEQARGVLGREPDKKCQAQSAGAIRTNLWSRRLGENCR